LYVEQIVIRNFRGIKSADIRLRPGLNVLVGRNGSGKSTVLQALRILLDQTLGRQARALNESDIYGNEKFAGPANVVIAARFAGFGDSTREKQLRLRFIAEDKNSSAWLLFRFRPKLEARNRIKEGEQKPSDLTLKDYESERLLRVTDDPHKIEWDSDPPNADALTDQDLNTLFVEEIQALRNVVDELRRQRTSPLAELLGTVDVPTEAQERVVSAYAEAQKTVEEVKALAEVATAIGDSYDLLTAESQIRIRLGLTPPGYAAIIQDLGVFLTDDQVADMDLRRNGLGFNNLLYIAMLLESFRRRVAKKEGSPILLVEEPEAHLHPQSQQALLGSIAGQPFQTVATTHSPYVAVTAGLKTIINLDRADDVKGINLVDAAKITPEELADLERFLNADRGAILFAAAVILVEGPAEQILVPLYAANQGRNLAKLGIQVCSINGTHFAAFQKLLGPDGLNRPFVTIRDGDQHRGGDEAETQYDDGRDISGLADEFITATTLEYAITRPDSLAALTEVAKDFRKRKLEGLLTAAVLKGDADGDLQLAVLKAAEDIGKARFAQALGVRVAPHALQPPAYIGAAVEACVGKLKPKAAGK
jgi:putative ATP-dependent endonuclease of OLD family